MNGEADNSLIPHTRRRRRIWRYAFIVYGTLGFGLLLFVVVGQGLLSLNAVAAMAIGGLVGAVEVLGRYQHAPFRAVLSLPGLFYVVINIAASWAAFYMIGAFEILKATTVAKDLTHILAAGFGSLVFMRSSVFKVKVGEADIGIGPAAILDALLMVADRSVDRREAVARAQDVTELVSHVRDPRMVAKMLTKYCLALMQNVDAATSQQLSDSIGQIMDDPDVPDEIRMDIVALQLGVVVGPDVLEAAVDALGSRLETREPRGSQGRRRFFRPGRATAKPVDGTEVKPSVAELQAEIERGLAVPAS